MIAVGVDTHKHEHLAMALDGLSQLVGGVTIAADPAGYLELADWLSELGQDVVVGSEGTGTYGAGLCEFLLAEPGPTWSAARAKARRTAKPCVR